MKGTAYHGWKFGLPDKFWSVTLDNFFDNPDEIRELGLRIMPEASKGDGRWPGFQSQELWKIDEELTQRICEKVLSCYFNLDFEKVFWNRVDMRFQLISSFDKDKNNTKNKGWIHRDAIDPRYLHAKNFLPDDNPAKQGEVPELAGLIYLTPDIERDTGTSLFNMKKDQTLEHYYAHSGFLKKVHLGKQISEEEVKDKWEKHRSCFIEKIRFENIYNRLIMFDCKEFHAANSFYTPEDKDDRLTLGFFIGGIKANKWPLERLRNN